GVDTAVVALFRGSGDFRSAPGTLLRRLDICLASRVLLVVDDLGDFGDDVAAALDLDPIANLHAQAPNLIHVVQRGIADGRAPNGNRGQLGHGREFPGAANLPAHVL